MRFRAHNPPRGFTLVELLTVIAIIAVLATLVAASTGSARKKARRTVSVSNLRQIALGYNLYTTDHDRRPLSFKALEKTGHLHRRLLICPEDKTSDHNWAGSIFSMSGRSAPGSPAIESSTGTEELPHSYFKSFGWEDELWDQVQKDPLAGVAACQLHGIGRVNWAWPSLHAFEGDVLRALKDGSVLSKTVFWNQNGSMSTAAPGLQPSRPAELPLLMDEGTQP